MHAQAPSPLHTMRTGFEGLQAAGGWRCASCAQSSQGHIRGENVPASPTALQCRRRRAERVHSAKATMPLAPAPARHMCWQQLAAGRTTAHTTQRNAHAAAPISSREKGGATQHACTPVKHAIAHTHTSTHVQKNTLQHAASIHARRALARAGADATHEKQHDAARVPTRLGSATAMRAVAAVSRELL